MSSAVFEPSAAGGAGAWTPVPGTNPEKAKTATVLGDGTVLVTNEEPCGTVGSPVNCWAMGHVYDPAAGSGSGGFVAELPGLFAAAATLSLLPTGEVLGAGGVTIAPTARVWDPDAGKTAVDPPMAAQHTGHTATVLPSGDVLVLGGNQAGVELRLAPGRVREVAGRMVQSRAVHAMARLRDGKALVVGGDQLYPAKLLASAGSSIP